VITIQKGCIETNVTDEVQLSMHTESHLNSLSKHLKVYSQVTIRWGICDAVVSTRES